MKQEELQNIKRLEGRLIAFPTDTVYGVGALINDEISIKKIYELKHRDFTKPLAILVGSTEDALKLFANLPEKAINLMKKYWPGELTIIGKKSERVPQCLNPSFDTIGLRMPNNQVALEILKKFGPLATTSINNSGEEPINNYEEINEKYHNKIDYIFESNSKSSNISSTVIEIIDDEIKIIREGKIKIM